MAEYIDRDAALAVIQNLYPGIPLVKANLQKWHEQNRDFMACETAIERIHAADVRPVVLCRDCDCWNDWDSAGRESLGNYVCSCAYWTVEDGAVFYTRPTDFCSYGERKMVFVIAR